MHHNTSINSLLHYAFKLVIIIYDKIKCITVHIMNNYNALYIKALSKVWPFFLVKYLLAFEKS